MNTIKCINFLALSLVSIRNCYQYNIFINISQIKLIKFALLVGGCNENSILFIIEMIGVTIVVKLSEGFVGGFELELLLMSVAISLLITGPGKISIEYNILKREIFPKGKMIVNEIRQQEKG
jgi:hypothetical protein